MDHPLSKQGFEQARCLASKLSARQASSGQTEQAQLAGGTVSWGSAAARAAEAERRLGSGVQQVLLLPDYPTTL